MGGKSTSIDLTEHVKHTRQSVRGAKLSQSLAESGDLAPALNPEVLFDEARRRTEEKLLSTLMPSTIVDEDGMVVANSPAYVAGGADEVRALRHDIVRNEGLRRQMDVQGLIEPPRQVIQYEHPLDFRDFRVIVEMTPFVPSDWVEPVTTGFTRFFGGDFFSELHVRVPQLENSLRHILKLAGLEPSAIRSDMTQVNRTLSVMFDKERGPLEWILGPAIFFEIENLFDLRGGPALRHQIAHGLISAAECQGTDSIYAWWFMFRLCRLPLFPHWDEVER